jgi:hypothetical protein
MVNPWMATTANVEQRVEWDRGLVRLFLTFNAHADVS